MSTASPYGCTAAHDVACHVSRECGGGSEGEDANTDGEAQPFGNHLAGQCKAGVTERHTSQRAPRLSTNLLSTSNEGWTAELLPELTSNSCSSSNLPNSLWSRSEVVSLVL